MKLPAAASPGWYVHDLRLTTIRAEDDAVLQPPNGALMEFEQVPEGELWLLERAVAVAQASDVPALNPVRFYSDRLASHSFIGISSEVYDGHFVWEPPIPVQLHAGTKLLTRWQWTTTPPPELAFVVRVQLVILRRI